MWIVLSVLLGNGYLNQTTKNHLYVIENRWQKLAALREEVLYVIFLELNKEYDALDWSRCPEILEGWGVVPWACRLFRTYWRRLTMVARADAIMGRRLRCIEEWRREIHSPPPYSMWWWMWWWGTGWWWWWRARKSRASVDKRVGVIMPSSTRIMTWLHCRTQNGSRVHLVPWSACSIGWACGLISGRYLSWSAAHTRRWGPSRRRRMGERWQERGPPTWSCRWDGDGIIGEAHDDTAWASIRVEMELETLVHGVRAVDVPHGLPGQGRPAELPGEWIPRASGNEDGDAGTFYAPACLGHRGYFGGGRHPPHTVPPMWHDGPLAYTEQKAPCHRTVLQGSGSEEAAGIDLCYNTFSHIGVQYHHYPEHDTVCLSIFFPWIVFCIFPDQWHYFCGALLLDGVEIP